MRLVVHAVESGRYPLEAWEVLKDFSRTGDVTSFNC